MSPAATVLKQGTAGSAVHTMLKALRARQRPSDDQSSSPRPMSPIAVDRSWISFTARTIVETSLSGNIRQLRRDTSTRRRPNSPSSDTEEVGGTTRGARSTRSSRRAACHGRPGTSRTARASGRALRATRFGGRVGMDAAEALRDLTEISSQIEAAVLVTSGSTSLRRWTTTALRNGCRPSGRSSTPNDERGERTLVQIEAATSGASSSLATTSASSRRSRSPSRPGLRFLRPQELPRCSC